MARQLPRPEADLVSPAPERARQRRLPAGDRSPRIRCLALARLLDSARERDRVQARGVSPRAARARALSARQAADAPRAPVRLRTPGHAAVVRGCGKG